MSRYVKVDYPDNWLTQIMERTEAQIAEMKAAGMVVTPLVEMTPERIAAIKFLANAQTYEYDEQGRLRVGFELAIAYLHAMLAETEGGSNES